MQALGSAIYEAIPAFPLPAFGGVNPAKERVETRAGVAAIRGERNVTAEDVALSFQIEDISAKIAECKKHLEELKQHGAALEAVNTNTKATIDTNRGRLDSIHKETMIERAERPSHRQYTQAVEVRRREQLLVDAQTIKIGELKQQVEQLQTKAERQATFLERLKKDRANTPKTIGPPPIKVARPKYKVPRVAETVQNLSKLRDGVPVELQKKDGDSKRTNGYIVLVDADTAVAFASKPDGPPSVKIGLAQMTRIVYPVPVSRNRKASRSTGTSDAMYSSAYLRVALEGPSGKLQLTCKDVSDLITIAVGVSVLAPYSKTKQESRAEMLWAVARYRVFCEGLRRGVGPSQVVTTALNTMLKAEEVGVDGEVGGEGAEET